MFKKIFLTIIILAIYKMVSMIILPGIDPKVITETAVEKSGFLQTLNVLAGGGIDKCSILAINIMPYITATILTQVLSSRTHGIEYFQNLKNNRELGSAKLNEYTQYFTVLIAGVSAIFMLSHIFGITYGSGVSAVFISKVRFFIVAIPILVAGCLFSVWISHQISKYGVGQGTSVLIFANIVSSFSGDMGKIYSMYKKGTLGGNNLLMILILFFTIFLIVIFVEGCSRPIPTIYPGLSGAKVEQSLPLKINNAGVIPPTFASIMVSIPSMLSGALQKLPIAFHTETIDKYISYFNQGGPFYYIFYSLLLFAVTISQTEAVFDPTEISRNLQENGAVIVRVRPGLDTTRYLRSILNKLNFLAGLYLIFICVISEFFCKNFNRTLGTNVLHLSGTSILIMVSVAQLIFKGAKNYNYELLIDPIKITHNKT